MKNNRLKSNGVANHSKPCRETV